MEDTEFCVVDPQGYFTAKDDLDKKVRFFDEFLPALVRHGDPEKIHPSVAFVPEFLKKGDTLLVQGITASESAFFMVYAGAVEIRRFRSSSANPIYALASKPLARSSWQSTCARPKRGVAGCLDEAEEEEDLPLWKMVELGQANAAVIRRYDLLREMVNSLKNTEEVYTEKHKSWCYLPQMAFLSFAMHGPIGVVFARSLLMTRSLRAMLLGCELLGALMVVTLFFSAGAQAPDADDQCSGCQGNEHCEWQRLGTMMAVGLSAALLAAMPVGLISSAHTREFVRVPYEGSHEWHKTLRNWRRRDRFVWTAGLLYSFFAINYICLFFANVSADDQLNWFQSGAVTLTQDFVLGPTLVAFAMPVTALIMLGMLACRLGVRRGHVLAKKIRGTMASETEQEPIERVMGRTWTTNSGRQATIKQDTVEWDDGEVWPVASEGNERISVVDLCGKKHIANVIEDRLEWDDGDVWATSSRRTSESTSGGGSVEHRPSTWSTLTVTKIGGAVGLCVAEPAAFVMDPRVEDVMASTIAGVAGVAAASAVALAQAPALAEVDYVNIEYLGGSNKVDINNANVQAYRQFPGMFPYAAGFIATHGPYKEVSDIYKEEKLDPKIKEIIQKYEKNLVCFPPSPAYFIDRINNAMYR